MCDPITIAMIAAGVGSVISASSQKSAARTQSNATESAAKRNADQTEYVAEENVKIHRQKTQRLLARQRTAFLKSGVQLVGTPEEVLAQTAADEELNALAAYSSGQLTSQNIRTNASFSAGAALQEGNAGATATLISGGTSILSMNAASKRA